MTILKNRETLLDRIPRCILGQLVRDRFGIMDRGGIDLVSFRTSIFESPAGRWCLSHSSSISSSESSIETTLPFYLMEMMVGLEWVSESASRCWLTPEGRRAIQNIQMSLSKVRKGLVGSSVTGSGVDPDDWEGYCGT